jgi:hypothetical protein
MLGFRGVSGRFGAYELTQVAGQAYELTQVAGQAYELTQVAGQAYELTQVTQVGPLRRLDGRLFDN